MTFIAGLGGKISDIAGSLSDNINSIISQIIAILRDIISYIYIFFLRFWNFIIDNPRGSIMLFANTYVFML